MSEKKKYRTVYQCTSCKNTFTRTTSYYPRKDPPCQKCKNNKKIKTKSSVSDKTHNLSSPEERCREMIVSGKAPSVGGSNIVKAVDETARIVMEDHKMTDLKSNVRAGETMAPKLAPALQKQVDGFFGGNKKNRALPFNEAQLKRQALSGALRDAKADPIAALQPRHKPKVNFVAGDGIK